MRAIVIAARLMALALAIVMEPALDSRSAAAATGAETKPAIRPAAQGSGSNPARSQDAARIHPPNIVVIVADDLGWADVSFHGGEVRTPNLDRLVGGGAELRRFYTSPLCSPTRVGLMTGRYPIRLGLMRDVIAPWQTAGLEPDRWNLPEVLARAGYRDRGIIGKWHLGQSKAKHHPLQHGFTTFVGHYTGSIDYFTHVRRGELDWHRDYAPNRDAGYTTDLIGEEAVSFIRRASASPEPFLLYIAFNAPHTPLQAKPEDSEPYAFLRLKHQPAGGQGPGGTPLPGSMKNREYARVRPIMAGMISSLDQAVGRILDALETSGVADDSLVWFFSDNGGTTYSDNRPLRGHKGALLEGGVRVPSAVRWTGRIEAGSRIEAPLAYIDVLPTLAGIVGAPSPGPDDPKRWDGVDASGLLLGTEAAVPRSIFGFVGRAESMESVSWIEDDWKLIVTGPRVDVDAAPDRTRKLELYDLRRDPSEERNLAADHPDRVRSMRVKLEAHRALQPDGLPPITVDHQFKAPRDWKIPGTLPGSESTKAR